MEVSQVYAHQVLNYILPKTQREGVADTGRSLAQPPQQDDSPSAGADNSSTLSSNVLTNTSNAGPNPLVTADEETVDIDVNTFRPSVQKPNHS